MSEFLCTDVLAIRCVNNFIFVGIGYTLHVFNKDNFELEEKVKSLYPCNIHGIVDGPNNKLAVFGANLICVYNIDTENGTFNIQECCTMKHKDWIITVNWLQIENHIRLSVLLAHNNVHIYDILDKDHKNIWCQEKCILYGGSISVINNKDLVIFSGTVFQEILIWEVKHDHYLEPAPVLHRLKGHNGVIFSVIYDPLRNLICSTSDDRTVRLWKVIPSCSLKENSINWEKAEIQLIKTMFGHTARDSLICTWSLDGKLLNKVCAHNGAAIWSIELSKKEEIIFTGGADGAVNILPLVTNCIQDTIDLPKTSKNDVESVPKYVCYLNSGAILIFKEGGNLLCYDGSNECPSESLYLKKYSSYCIMQVSRCRYYVCFASIDGHVAMYKETIDSNDRKLHRIFEEKIMESQIYSLHWLLNNEIVVCGADGILKILNFTAEGSIHVKAICRLPVSRERWLTAAIIFKELLICGDRAGDLHVFEIGKVISREQSPTKIEAPVIQSISNIHGRIGVQDFGILGSKLLSAGRDGLLRFYELHECDDSKTLHSLHKEKMPMDWISGTLKRFDDILVLGFKEVEFLVFSITYQRTIARIPCGGGHRSWDCTLLNESIKFAYIRNKKLFIFNSSLPSPNSPTLMNGFHSKEVYCIQPIENMGQQNIFLSGGEDSTLRITCIRAGSSKNCIGFQTLGIFDGHISGIKSIATTSLEYNSSSSKHLVFSCGGRAQIKIWMVNLKRDKSKLLQDISCYDLGSHMLYGLDRNRRKHWQQVHSYVMQPETRYMDIDVYRASQSPRYIFLFVACADGCVRIFVYDTDANSIYLKMHAKSVDRCILKIRVIGWKENVIALTMSTDGIVRCIDFTNVILKILEDEPNYKASDQIQDYLGKPFGEMKFHQSGINSYDLKTFAKEGEFLLATGGDDNLFNLVYFKFCPASDKKEASISLLSKWSTSSAHTAQITGIKFKDCNKICSVGMDQQVIMYSYEYQNGVLAAKMINNILSSVTDVQGLFLWFSSEDDSTKMDKSYICVYGKGFEVLSCT